MAFVLAYSQASVTTRNPLRFLALQPHLMEEILGIEGRELYPAGAHLCNHPILPLRDILESQRENSLC
jgi:hypothetical protein